MFSAARKKGKNASFSRLADLESYEYAGEVPCPVRLNQAVVLNSVVGSLVSSVAHVVRAVEKLRDISNVYFTPRQNMKFELCIRCVTERVQLRVYKMDENCDDVGTHRKQDFHGHLLLLLLSQEHFHIVAGGDVRRNEIRNEIRNFGFISKFHF